MDERETNGKKGKWLNKCRSTSGEIVNEHVNVGKMVENKFT